MHRIYNIINISWINQGGDKLKQAESLGKSCYLLVLKTPPQAFENDPKTKQLQTG